MSIAKAAFVLVHGGWHNHSVWDKVTPILQAQGFAALTLDLPGAGAKAIAPKSLSRRPFDPTAFATERSPMAVVTQEQRRQAVAALVKEAASLSDGKVILVGHSAGGMTISAVAERVPDMLLAIVYVAGFMAPNGAPLLAMLQHETFSSALSPGLFVGDPAAIGATRIHAGSTDEAYRSLLKASFYADVVGRRLRACRVATSLRRIKRRRLSPIGNHARKIWRGPAPLHPLHTGSRSSVDRPGSYDCNG
jgi:pimeloyl-ACP methyl ester carboxylesterase